MLLWWQRCGMRVKGCGETEAWREGLAASRSTRPCWSGSSRAKQDNEALGLCSLSVMLGGLTAAVCSRLPFFLQGWRKGPEPFVLVLSSSALTQQS